MKSTVSEWASIAEIIGAVAIVILLVFVGLEIRKNSDATYAATYDQLIADLTDWRKTLAGDRLMTHDRQTSRS